MPGIEQAIQPMPQAERQTMRVVSDDERGRCLERRGDFVLQLRSSELPAVVAAQLFSDEERIWTLIKPS